MVLWRSLTQWVSRLFVVPTLLFASGDPATPEYPVENSMSTLARFPWIWTCVHAISSDMAGLPLVASRRTGRRATDRELVDDPALDLLEQPNAGTTGYLFKKQLWVDFLLPGNAFIWRPMGADGRVVAVYRLHPRQVYPIPGPLGIAAGYEWRDDNGVVRILPPSEVIHIRDVSWQDTAAQIFGESVIRCLHDDLTTELGARQTAAKQASKARPDVLFSVKTQLQDKGSEQLVRRWETAISKRHGAFVVGGDVSATTLGWSPRDFDFLERSDRLRDTTLAVFGVPPTRAGLTTANYGASRQEMRVYWENNIRRAKVFEDAFSQLAGARVRIEHDFTTVEALQVSYTERLMRVSTWVGLGATPAAAARYEGFDDAPVGDSVDDFHSPRPIDRQPEEPQEDRDKGLAGRVRAAVLLHLRCAEAAYSELGELGDEIDRRLFVRWQTERLFAGLVEAGVADADARWWAEELCGIVDEQYRIGLAADPVETAGRFADRIAARRAA